MQWAIAADDYRDQGKHALISIAASLLVIATHLTGDDRDEHTHYTDTTGTEGSSWAAQEAQS